MKTVQLTLILISILANSIFGQKNLSDTIPINEAVITGTKVEVSRKNIPLSVTSITEEEIVQSNETNVLPLISQQVPGVFVTERGVTGFGVSTGAAGKISVRGIGGSPNTQVLMLIDGHPQYMGIFGHPLPDAYVTTDVEKIEVIRGPASILYGSNAMGGVVNIITKKQKEDGLKGALHAMYGSYNTQKYSGSLGYKKNKLSTFVSVNREHTDGHRDTSNFDITNSYLKLGYQVNEHINAMVDFSVADFISEDPGAESTVGTIPQFFEVDITRGKAALSIDNKYASFEGALKVFYNFGEHDLSDGWHSNDRNTGIMFYQSFNPFAGNTLTLGIDYKNFGGKGSPIATMLKDEDGNVVFENGGPKMVLSPYNDEWTTIDEYAFYAYSQQKIIDNLRLSAGIRYENNSVYGDEWIPQVGVVYRPLVNTSLKASVSKGFRSPTIRELYLFPPANEDLKPERMMSYDFSLIQDLLDNKLNIELTGYIADGENLIITIPAPPPPPRNVNSGKFNHKGVELLAKYKITRSTFLHLNYAYLSMKEPVLAAPESQLFLNVRQQFGKFNLSVNTQMVNNLYLETGDTPLTEDYFLLNARLNYKINRSVSVYTNAKNILNQDYAINFDYPMPGFTIFAGININFD